MRICLLSREYPPDTAWGGIATFAKHLAHGLQEIGHEVEVVSLAKAGAGQSTTDVEGVRVHRVEPHIQERDLGLLFYTSPTVRYTIGATFPLWSKFVELHKQKPFDLVDTPELLAEGLLPSIAKVVPLVVRLYTPHFMFISEGLHNAKPNFDHQIVALGERFSLLNADAITAPSRDLAEFVARDLNFPVEGIGIVMNPIDTEEFTPDGPGSLLKDGRLKILFVGRLEERKGVHYLVEAMPAVLQKFPDAHFYVIGSDTTTAKGHRSVLAELKKSIAHSKSGANVTFIPQVPLPELPAYYRSADVCVVPSVYDNSPYSCLEAMSCGRAVIGTTAGGAKEYMVDGESGLLVPPRDASAIAATLIRLLENDEERAKLGANARQRVLSCFKRSEIARQMVELYLQAQKNFEVRRLLPQYRRQADQLLPDAAALIDAFHDMIHDTLYLFSWRYRCIYWMHLIRTRPKLFAARIVLGLLKPVGAIPYLRDSALGSKKKWLEERVEKLSAKSASTEKPVECSGGY